MADPSVMRGGARSGGRPGLPPLAHPLVFGALGAAVGLSVWALAAFLLAGGGGVISRLPSPLLVVRNIVSYAADGLAGDLAASLQVFAAGWIVGTALAALVGLALGRIGLLRRMFVPVIETIRPVSSIAWVPLSVVWFGFGLAEKVFLVALAVFLVVVVYALDGARRVPPDLERTATMLGMNPWQRFLALVLPGTLVEVLIGARLALMAGWGTVIVAELVAADRGIGAHLVAVQQSYDVGAVVATMACFGVTGLVMNTVFDRIEARLVPWRPDSGNRVP